MDYSFIKSLQSQERIIISIPQATHGEFSDEPFIFHSLGVPWIRKDFNELKTAYSIHASVFDILYNFLSVLDHQENKSNATLKFINYVKKYDYKIMIINKKE